MASSWQDLTRVTAGRDFAITKVRLKDSEISLEGNFDLPPLARLSYDDQVFVASFVRAHGSIKDMEALFGVSYPTIKGRLNRIAQKLDFVEVQPVSEKDEVLGQLERGEISAAQAIERLGKL